ncbi:hypothetical protein RZS08_65640, partial [Arthrospira platensis SPKY1]|nr:hypothetical protein [Arthrospira platensis SPKY1]
RLHRLDLVDRDAAGRVGHELEQGAQAGRRPVEPVDLGGVGGEGAVVLVAHRLLQAADGQRVPGVVLARTAPVIVAPGLERQAVRAVVGEGQAVALAAFALE